MLHSRKGFGTMGAGRGHHTNLFVVFALSQSLDCIPSPVIVDLAEKRPIGPELQSPFTAKGSLGVSASAPQLPLMCILGAPFCFLCFLTPTLPQGSTTPFSGLPPPSSHGLTSTKNSPCFLCFASSHSPPAGNPGRRHLQADALGEGCYKSSLHSSCNFMPKGTSRDASGVSGPGVHQSWVWLRIAGSAGFSKKARDVDFYMIFCDFICWQLI